jgi:hypothetical protein
MKKSSTINSVSKFSNIIVSLIKKGSSMRIFIFVIIAALVTINSDTVAQTNGTFEIKYEQKLNENEDLKRALADAYHEMDSLRRSHIDYKIQETKEKNRRNIIEDSTLQAQERIITEKDEKLIEILSEPQTRRMLEVELTKGVILNNNRFSNQFDLCFRHGIIREDYYSILIESAMIFDKSKLSGVTLPGFSGALGFDLYLNNSNKIVPAVGVSIGYSLVNVSDLINEKYYDGTDQGFLVSGRFGLDFVRYRLGFFGKVTWRMSIDSDVSNGYGQYNGLKIAFGGKFIL